jgi:hypothetical protein
MEIHSRGRRQNLSYAFRRAGCTLFEIHLRKMGHGLIAGILPLRIRTAKVL